MNSRSLPLSERGNARLSSATSTIPLRPGFAVKLSPVWLAHVAALAAILVVFRPEVDPAGIIRIALVLIVFGCLWLEPKSGRS